MLDKRDKFDEILKNRYDEFHADVPAWGELFGENELDQIKTQRGFLFRRAAIISAVAALISVGVFLSVNNIVEDKPTTTTVTTVVASKDKIEVKKETAIEKKEIVVSKNYIAKLSNKKAATSITTHIEENIVIDTIISQQVVENSSVQNKKEESKKVENKKNSKNTGSWIANEPMKSKKRGKLSLIAATSFMPSAGGAQTKSAMAMYNAPIAVNINSYRNSVNFDNDEYNHKFPINVSLLVRYEIVNRLSIGAGVNYSYMESTAKNTEKLITYSLKQKVNYLGIPLSLNYDFLRTKRFTMYGLVGGMVEFNVGSVNEIQCYSDDKHINTQRDKIYADRSLFSLQGGVGAKYNIINGFGIFVEPCVNYVFHNLTQPITYKTNTPLQFNLRIGLSLDL